MTTARRPLQESSLGRNGSANQPEGTIMSVYPTAKAPKTQPKVVSAMLSSLDISPLAAEIQTRSTIVKNESVHKHATTYQRCEGPFAWLGIFANGLKVEFVFGINEKVLGTAFQRLFAIDF